MLKRSMSMKVQSISTINEEIKESELNDFIVLCNFRLKIYLLKGMMKSSKTIFLRCCFSVLFEPGKIKVCLGE